MHWTVAGADAIIALRCCTLSGRFEDFWERRSAARAVAAYLTILTCAQPPRVSGKRRPFLEGVDLIDS
jgi:hypothetical protein